MRQAEVPNSGSQSSPTFCALSTEPVLYHPSGACAISGGCRFLENLRAPANTTITLYSKLQYPVPIKICPYAYPTRHEVVGKRRKRTSTYLKQRNGPSFSVPVTGLVILAKGRTLHSRETNPGHALKWRRAQGWSNQKTSEPVQQFRPDGVWYRAAFEVVTDVSQKFAASILIALVTSLLALPKINGVRQRAITRIFITISNP
jgi:hypothetical protein